MTTIQRSVSVAAPASEPLSLREAKKHLEIAQSDTAHDEHVDDLRTAVREQWEHDTQSITVARAVTEKLDRWPNRDWRFFHRPVVSVTSVNYFDTGNVSQLLASSVYSLDAPNRRLFLAVDQDWPSHESRWDAITIVYQAGEATVSEIAKSAMKLQLDVLFELRGMTKEKDACQKAYERLVERYMRASYP